MDLFLSGKFSDYINACEEELKGVFDPDNASSILCNIASAEYELEMYRKCIKTCQGVLELKTNCLRAHFIHLQALVKLGKDDQCKEICERILTDPSNSFLSQDISIVLEIKKLREHVVLRLSRINTKSTEDDTVPSFSGNTVTHERKSEMSNTSLSATVTVAICDNNHNNSFSNERIRIPKNEVIKSQINNDELNVKEVKVLQNQTTETALHNQQVAAIIIPSSSTMTTVPLALEINYGKGTETNMEAGTRTGNANQKKKNRKVQNKSVDITEASASTSSSITSILDKNDKISEIKTGSKSLSEEKSSIDMVFKSSKGKSQTNDLNNNNQLSLKSAPISIKPIKVKSLSSSLSSSSSNVSTQDSISSNSSLTHVKNDTKLNDKKNMNGTSVTSTATNINGPNSTHDMNDKKTEISITNTIVPETKITRHFLENFLASLLVTEDALVIRTLLKSVRSSLCCANGDVIVDDMIAFGYLQVNTGIGLPTFPVYTNFFYT